MCTRSLRASSSFSSSCSGSPHEGGLGLPPEPSTGSDLGRIAFITFEVVIRIRAAEAKVVKGAAQGASFAIGKKEGTIHKSDYDLDFYPSRVTQAQVGSL